MIHKGIGLSIVLLWAVATGWLIAHDILPAWTAQDPPKVVAADWVKRYGKNAQFGIYDGADHRIGGIWTGYNSATSTDREDEIHLFDLPVLGPTEISIKSVFNLDGRLDEIDLNVMGAWNTVRIHGERFPSQFAFRIDAGAFKQVFKIDLSLAGTFSASFRPFDAMPSLEVGQSWRMQVFNPVAAVTGLGEKFIPMVVRVIGREPVDFNSQPRDCFVLEAPQTKAWVDAESGVVLLQQISLPLGGTFRVRYEPYDDNARREAAERFLNFRNTLGRSSVP